MKLYDATVSGNAYKVRLILAHLGLEYERIELSVTDRSDREERLGGKNPALRVPTLERKAIGAMERRLAEHDFLVADRYTVADICLYGYTHMADQAGIDLAEFPAVTAWVARCAAQPGHVLITE